MGVLVLIAILCCVVYVWSWFRPRPDSPPVLPGALPLFGHTLQAIGDRTKLWKFLQRIQKYSLSKGGVIVYWLGPHPAYVITDPEDALKVSNSCLNKPYLYNFSKDFLEHGLVTLEGKFKPILDQLLQLAEEQNVFTDEVIREHLDTIVTAATETTSSALTLIMIVVGSWPWLQERVYSELQEVFKHKDADVTREDLPKLVYLEAVIKETMRLYPVSLIVGRIIEKDLKLKNYTLPSGSSCFIGLSGLSRHPAWGKDVDQFRPERWLDPATLPDCPGIYSGFSIGRRNCIAKLYTMMVMKTALAHIFRRYYVTADITKLEYGFTVVSAPTKGHDITLTFRS